MFADQNKRAMLNLEALVERFGYGELNTKVEFHNKRIVKQTFYGQERKKYNKDSFREALSDIVKRIKADMDAKRTTKVLFQVEIRNGVPEQILWFSDFEVVYDQHGKEVDNSDLEK